MFYLFFSSLGTFKNILLLNDNDLIQFFSSNTLKVIIIISSSNLWNDQICKHVFLSLSFVTPFIFDLYLKTTNLRKLFFFSSDFNQNVVNLFIQSSWAIINYIWSNHIFFVVTFCFLLTLLIDWKFFFLT